MSAKPVFSWFGIVYFLFMIVFCFGSIKLVKIWADKSTYLLSESELEGEGK